MSIGRINEPLLNNDRAKREWLWLCRRFGEAEAREAIERITTVVRWLK